jgi:hypothetical protein
MLIESWKNSTQNVGAQIQVILTRFQSVGKEITIGSFRQYLLFLESLSICKLVEHKVHSLYQIGLMRHFGQCCLVVTANGQA